MGQRSFWKGMMAGGIVAATLTWIYMAPEPEREQRIRKIEGSIRKAGSLICNMGAR